MVRGLRSKLGIGLTLTASLGVAATATALAQDGGTGAGLYTVDLASGRTSLVGTIGDGIAVEGLAAAAAGGALLALTEDGRLLTFYPAAPVAPVVDVEISGLGDDETLLGIDTRPATGELFGVSDASVIYVIDPESGEAEAVGEAFDPAIEGDVVGFDFNPTVDRIRLVTNTGQNLRLNPDTGQIGSNPDTGAPTIDGVVAYAAGDVNAGVEPALTGAGYTNSVDGAESTQLYVVDSAQGVLALQDPPNDGILNTVGPIGPAGTTFAAFDITPAGAAYGVR